MPTQAEQWYTWVFKATRGLPGRQEISPGDIVFLHIVEGPDPEGGNSDAAISGNLRDSAPPNAQPRGARLAVDRGEGARPRLA